MKKIKCLTALLPLLVTGTVTPVISSCSKTNSDQNKTTNTKKQTNNISTLNKQNVCKVTFSAGDTGATLTGTTVAEIKSGRKFGSIDKPTATKSGFKFLHWACNDVEIKDSDSIDESKTVVPVFSQNKSTVSFNTMGGVPLINNIEVSPTDTWEDIKEDVPAITKTDAEFICWKLQNGETVKDSTVFSTDTSLTASWKEKVPTGFVKVSFNKEYQKEEQEYSVLVEKGSKLSTVNKPHYFKTSATYVKFQDTAGNIYDDTTEINNSVTLSPLWINEVIKENYMGVFAYEDSYFSFHSEACTNEHIVYYSQTAEEGSWQELTVDTVIKINKGNSLYFYSNNESGWNKYNSTDSTWTDLFYFNIQGEVALSGNVMSLVKDEDSEEIPTTIPNVYCFYRLFNNCAGIKSISNNFLPATTLKANCYEQMFQNCPNLVEIPEDLFTKETSITLTSSCCKQMFAYCINLKEIPATLLKYFTLASNCYESMFAGCISLTEVPEDFLPATTLATYCYKNMFKDCSNITTIPENLLQATTLKEGCYYGLFDGCSKLANSLTLSSTTLTSYCYYRMFANCSALTSAPAIPATTLNTYCCGYMFYNCANLQAAPEVPQCATKSYCYQSMFEGCKMITTAPTLGATSLTSYCYNAMFKDCISLTACPALSATTLAEGCYKEMFYGCTTITSAPALGAATMKSYCYASMFAGCTGLTTAPALNSTSLATYCYQQMFDGCTSLGSCPTLSATTLKEGCYMGMFKGCTTITSSPALPASSLSWACYEGMFMYCTNLKTVGLINSGNAVSAGDLSLVYMFYECSSLYVSKSSGTKFCTMPSSLGTYPQLIVQKMFYGCNGGAWTTDPTASSVWYYQTK